MNVSPVLKLFSLHGSEYYEYCTFFCYSVFHHFAANDGRSFYLLEGVGKIWIFGKTQELGFTWNLWEKICKKLRKLNYKLGNLKGNWGKP